MAYIEAVAYDAGAMYYEEMLMKRMLMKMGSLKYIASFIYDFLCGYGEKHKNIVLNCIAIVIFFVIIYFIADGSVYSDLALSLN